MAGINKVILVGNLGNDPNVLTFENGVKKRLPFHWLLMKHTKTKREIV